MAKYAVTVSNGKILTITAASRIIARAKVEAQIVKRQSKLTVTDVRLISGIER